MNIEDRIIEAIGARGIQAQKLRQQFSDTREATWLTAIDNLGRGERVSLHDGRVRRMTERAR